MSRIVTDYNNPIAIVCKLTFQLDNKTDNLTALGFKLYAQGIFIIQKSAEFHAAHGLLDFLLPSTYFSVTRLFRGLGIAHVFVKLAQAASPQGMSAFAFVVCHYATHSRVSGFIENLAFFRDLAQEKISHPKALFYFSGFANHNVNGKFRLCRHPDFGRFPGIASLKRHDDQNVDIQISVAFLGLRPSKGMMTRMSTSESSVGLP